MTTIIERSVGGLLVMLAVGCVSEKRPAETAEPAPTPPPVPEGGTIIEIAPRSESKLSGTARFEPQGDGLRVVVRVVDAPPGEHGVHIHEVGNCTAPDASSAGEHYNPDSHDLGRPPATRHLGDFGNLTVAEDGTGTLEIVVPGANLEPDNSHSFLGRAIIVHAQPDDGSQPSGNSGPRIGCGVIEG
jgi:Cu-Zn family superoxide dismutase